MSFSMSCKLPRLRPNGKAPTGSSPATLHHHSPSTRPHHAKSIHFRPRHHRPHRRRTTTTSQVHHPIVMCLWMACGREYGKQRNDRWQLGLPRSSPSVGHQHQRRCQLGHRSLTNRTNSQQNYEKGNPSKLTPCIPPIFPPTHHSRFPSRVPYQPQSAPHILGP